MYQETTVVIPPSSPRIVSTENGDKENFDGIVLATADEDTITKAEIDALFT